MIPARWKVRIAWGIIAFLMLVGGLLLVFGFALIWQQRGAWTALAFLALPLGLPLALLISNWAHAEDE